jgi:hypothetical protein
VGLMKYIRTQWDRTGAAVCIVIGLLALLFGWIGTSNTPYVAKQLPYILSGGLTGIFFLGVGAVLWISADLRDEWREMHVVGDRLARLESGIAPPEMAAEPEPDLAPTENGQGGATAARRTAAARTRAKAGTSRS